MIKFLKNWATKRGQKYYIYDRARSDEVYMIRYILFKCESFGVYLHEFIQSDNEVHHDHPWDFVTYIVDGEYDEEILTHGKDVFDLGQGHTPFYALWTKSRRTVKKGRFLYRKANHIHRVILTGSYPTTLSIIFKKYREWGFWQPTNFGYTWTHWRDFLGIAEGPNKEQRM